MKYASAIVVFAVGCGAPGSPVRVVASSAGGASMVAPSAAPRPAASSVAITQLACGDFHSCALMGDGTVTCWGRNKEGELGDGTTDNANKPTTVAGVRNVAQIAGAAHSTCALLKDGTVTCWGGGKSWGDGAEKNNVPPTPVAGIHDAVAIDGGGLLLCALVKGGKVQCWGDDDAKGGISHYGKPSARPPESNATAITVAEAHACALLDGGSVRCWGDGAWGASTPAAFAAPPLRGATQVSTGDSVTCALVANGAVSCFGRNEQGEMGRAPDQDDHVKPLEVPGIANATKIVAGEAHLCAIFGDGAARCWGSNGDGELGRGTQGEPQRPGPLKLDRVVEIALGADHGCARTFDGAVYCWGSNAHGQIGDGTNENRTIPTKVAF